MGHRLRAVAASVAFALFMGGPTLAAVCAALCAPDAPVSPHAGHVHDAPAQANTHAAHAHHEAASATAPSIVPASSPASHWSAPCTDCWLAVALEASSETASRGHADGATACSTHAAAWLGSVAAGTLTGSVPPTVLPPLLAQSPLVLRI